MIALALAAALTAGDLQKMFDDEALTFYHVSESQYAQAETRWERRKYACEMAERASDAAFDLRKRKIDLTVVVMDPGLKAKIPGGVYKLQPTDMQALDYAILDAEQKAAHAKVECGV